MNSIKYCAEFLNDYPKIERAVSAKTLGASSNEILEELNQLKSRINKNENGYDEFLVKWTNLANMAKRGNLDMNLKVN